MMSKKCRKRLIRPRDDENSEIKVNKGNDRDAPRKMNSRRHSLAFFCG